MNADSRLVALILTLGLGLGLGLAASAAADESVHRLGVGVHYWKTLDNLVDDELAGIEDDGLAWVLSYQYAPAGLFRIELDLEYNDDGYGGADDSAISPLAWILIGHGLYGGLGAGFTISDSLEDNVSDPFFAGRIGFEFFLLPKVRIDVHGDYRTGAFDDLDRFGTDDFTLGATLRFNL